jgi:hypothetical protein
MAFDDLSGLIWISVSDPLPAIILHWTLPRTRALAAGRCE